MGYSVLKQQEQKICFNMKFLILTLFLVASVTSDDDNSDACEVLRDMAEKLAKAVIEDGEWNGEGEGQLFEFMTHNWDADGSGCFSKTEFKAMWDQLGVAVNAEVMYSSMDTNKDECISQDEWDHTVETIKKVCAEWKKN